MRKELQEDIAKNSPGRVLKSGEGTKFENFSWQGFEDFIADLFNSMGYVSKATKKSGDFGIDVIAKRKNDDKEMPDVIAIQVKHYAKNHNVGNVEVQKLLGAMQLKGVNANKGVLITSSDFTIQAKEQADGTNVELWNGQFLDRMVKKYMPSSNLNQKRIK